jgi:hypothetical protein
MEDDRKLVFPNLYRNFYSTEGSEAPKQKVPVLFMLQLAR